MNTLYATSEPTRAEIDALQGPTLIEFGTPWYPYCQAAQPLLAVALAAHPHVRHLKIEDGTGRRLGRSFQVKLWPTLIFLREGQEVARMVCPREARAIRQALAHIDPAP